MTQRSNPSDGFDIRVLEALRAAGGSAWTYVVRNWMDDTRTIPTASVLRSLRRLEKSGSVRQCHSISGTHLDWKLVRV